MWLSVQPFSHTRTIGNFLIPFHISHSSIEAYIKATHMDRDCAWGTEIEILTFAHLLHTPVLLYNTEHARWFRYSPHGVDVHLNDDVTLMSMYLWHPPGHF